MHSESYPRGTVFALIKSEHVTPQTAAVLTERLTKKERINPAFFSEAEFALLDAVCDCLYPQEEECAKIPLAIMVEETIATGKGKGWRYDVLPPTKELFTQGLKGIEEETKTLLGKSFIAASAHEQETILYAVQAGNVKATVWETFSPQLFFTELLVTATEQYYSHPLAKDGIGDVSFADQPFWQRIGLNEYDGRESLGPNSFTDARS